MLIEYKYHDNTGMLHHFMDDRQRAIELFEKGFKIFSRSADPFNALRYQPFLNDSSKFHSNRKWVYKTKYSYQIFKKIHQMREKGISIKDISLDLDISISMIGTMLYNRERGKVIESYRRRLENE